MAKSAGGRSSDAALAECFRKAVAHKKARSPLTTKRGDLILMENRNQAIDLLKSDTDVGVPLTVVADLFDIFGERYGAGGLTSAGRDSVSIAVRELRGKWPTSSPLKSVRK